MCLYIEGWGRHNTSVCICSRALGGAGYELQPRFSSLHNYKGKEWGEGEEEEEKKLEEMK